MEDEPREKVEERDDRAQEVNPYLTEVLDYEGARKGKINIIKAGCGSGKTTVALTTIPEKLGFKPNRGLFLTPLTATRDFLIKKEKVQGFKIKEEPSDLLPPEDLEKLEDNRFEVLTYAGFGSLSRQHKLNLNLYDCIICDELHWIVPWIGKDRTDIQKESPTLDFYQVGEILLRKSNCFAAAGAIIQALERNIWVFGLTATPEPLSKLKLFRGILQELQVIGPFRTYQAFKELTYTNLEELLSKPVQEETKRLLYFSTIGAQKEVVEKLRERGRRAIAIWSLSNKEEMGATQIQVRDYLLETEEFPPGIQDLVINDAYGVGLNISDPLVKIVIIHTGDLVKREQVKGRIRHNIEEIYYYNRKTSNTEKSQAAREVKKEVESSLIKESSLVINQYLNKPLFKKEKEELIKELNFERKWTSLKKALIANDFEVEEKRIRINGNQERYSIITESRASTPGERSEARNASEASTTNLNLFDKEKIND